MSLEQIKRDLEKDIVKNKSKLETWKRVTYLTKKDGSPYKIMAKNFENAKYGTRFNTFYLEISCECNNNQYKVYDDIFCGNKFQEYTLEKIKEKVIERIEYLKNRIKSQEYQLMIIDSVYEEFEQSYHDMCTRLKDACGTNQFGYINSIGNAIYQDIVGSDIF